MRPPLLTSIAAIIALPWLVDAAAVVPVPAAEPPGLRAAIAKHDARQAEIAQRLYGAVPEIADPSSYEFKYALVDLNEDGIPDAVVYFTDYCGSGGCIMRIYQGTRTGFEYVSGTLRVFPPILVLQTSVHGWKSLAVALREGGSGVLNFNGKRYPLSPPDGHPARASSLKGAVAIIE
jgi:hypothetical protein